MESSADLLVLTAVKGEPEGFRDRLASVRKRDLHGPWWRGEYRSARVDLLRSGIGPENARRSLQRYLTECPPPQRVLIVGFAGALDDRLGVADWAVGTQGVAEVGGPFALEPLALGGLEKALAGPVFSCGRFLHRPEEKREMAQKLGAIAVDMESQVWWELCLKMGAPTAWVKCITDTAGQTTPDFDSAFSQPGKAARAGWFVAHPAEAARLSRLLGQVGRAKAALRETAEVWLDTALEMKKREQSEEKSVRR